MTERDEPPLSMELEHTKFPRISRLPSTLRLTTRSTSYQKLSSKRSEMFPFHSRSSSENQMSPGVTMKKNKQRKLHNKSERSLLETSDENRTISSEITVKISNTKNNTDYIVPAGMKKGHGTSKRGRLRKLLRKMNLSPIKAQNISFLEEEARDPKSTTTLYHIDRVIRGRLDGVDCLLLGSVMKKPKPKRVLLDSLLLASPLNQPPTIVFEGHAPNGVDRWVARLESFSPSQKDVAESKDENLCLWEGETKPPPRSYSNEESCPVDIDEDLFVIENASHLRAAHRSAIDNLKCGQFKEANAVFHKILRSHKEMHGNTHYLVGSALHNIGICQLWSGHFQQAFSAFRNAVSVRIKSLHAFHQNVAVSLVQKGFAAFALGKFETALEDMNHAYKIQNHLEAGRNGDDLATAKILNNIGCIFYKTGSWSLAVDKFTMALELQHKWLSGHIRRESTILITASTLCNLGNAYFERGDMDLSIMAYEEALMLQSSVSSKDHKIIRISKANLSHLKSMRECDSTNMDDNNDMMEEL